MEQKKWRGPNTANLITTWRCDWGSWYIRFMVIRYPRCGTIQAWKIPIESYTHTVYIYIYVCVCIPIYVERERGRCVCIYILYIYYIYIHISLPLSLSLSVSLSLSLCSFLMEISQPCLMTLEGPIKSVVSHGSRRLSNRCHLRKKQQGVDDPGRRAHAKASGKLTVCYWILALL